MGGAIAGYESYDALIAREPSENLEDPVLGSVMLYTSGTTGRPKGVSHPNRVPAQVSSAGPPTSARMVGGESMALCTGPLYHAAPMAYSMAVPLYYGAGLVLMDHWPTCCMLWSTYRDLGLVGVVA